MFRCRLIKLVSFAADAMLSAEYLSNYKIRPVLISTVHDE